MECKKLKEDLTNCLINFDRRVLVTELLDDYKVPYEEVNNVLVDYLKEQEKTQKLKYEKRYIVHGHQEGGDNQKEIYKIVEEDKLKEWLKKLKNAESSLYSVEVAGGAKAPAAVFKPMSIEEGVKLRKGQSAKAANGAATTSSSVAVKKETKPDTKPETKKPEPQNATSKSPIKTVKAPAKKISPKAKTPTKKSPKTEDSPTDSKKSKEKSVQKKGINNFFASAGSTKKSSEDTKDNKSTGVVKPPTPKKMQDFFKKQPEKPKSAKETKPSVNTSVQLFDDEDEEPEEVASSDEEEKLDALKRGLVSSDVEMEDEDEEATKPTTSKRRRILDSDDEEDDVPLVKHEKLDIKEPEEVKEESSPQLDETYLDDEGFVITKKPKQKGQTTTPKSITTKKSPPVTKKISPKETKKSAAKDTKATSNPPAKTKQAGIMNFFTKK